MTARKPLIIAGIILYLAVTAVALSGLYVFLRMRNTSQPAVLFNEPLNETEIPVGGNIPVRITARDKSGIQSVALWIDGEIYASRVSALEDGSSPFPMVEEWQPQEPGLYLLTARAINSGGESATSSIQVHVLDQPDDALPTPITPADGEEEPGTVESAIKGSGVAGGETDSDGEEDVHVLRVNPDLMLPPLEEEISSYQPGLLEGLLLPPLFPREDTLGTLLEVEALTLKTSGEYDGVFCYYSMTGMPDTVQVPESGWFDTAGSQEWDIRSFFGEDNKTTVLIPEDAPNALGMMLECWGVLRDRGTVYNLGRLTVLHMPLDWNGVPIHQHIEGVDGFFDVSYRIRMAEGEWIGGGEELPPPNLRVDCVRLFSEDVCQLSWTYPVEYQESVNGFLVVRNGTLYRVIVNQYFSKILLHSSDGSMPDCGESDRYYVMAYSGDPLLGEQSARSNSVTVFSLCQYKWAKVSFLMFSGCYTGDCRKEDLCHCGELIPEGGYGPMEEDTSHDHKDIEGCLYADFWANDQNLDVGSSDKWDCWSWATSNNYRIGSTYAHADQNFVLVRLDDRDDLTIGMRIMDWDPVNDDTQCYGEYIYSAADLAAIAEMPGRKKQFVEAFNERGGGTCTLQYEIELMVPGFDEPDVP